MPNSVIAIFCEDIRQELGGQHTLVGVLPDNIAVPNLPGAMPKLGIYVRAQIERNHVPDEITVNFKNSDGTQIPIPTWDKATIEKGNADATINSLPTFGLILTAVLSPFSFPAAGPVMLSVTIDGVTYLAGLLNIILVSPTVSEPPASQSPSAS